MLLTLLLLLMVVVASKVLPTCPSLLHAPHAAVYLTPPRAPGRKTVQKCTHPVRASPKSQILRSQFALTSRLLGLRSRCSTLALCTYLRPRST